jgi:hypothetical protein
MRVLLAAVVVAAACAFSSLAAAEDTDDAPELWFNPSAEWALDDDTAVELETAQRLRREEDGRADTYFARLWLNQDLSDDLKASVGVERRENQPGSGETRLLQQVAISRGVFRSRLRMEQRFVDNADRTGVRFRPRAGVSVPVTADGRWSAKADAELFLTLRSTSRGGDEGLTGLRTQIGAEWEVNDRLSLTLAYLRQQDIREDAEDVVGHAPLIGVELSF